MGRRRWICCCRSSRGKEGSSFLKKEAKSFCSLAAREMIEASRDANIQKSFCFFFFRKRSILPARQTA
jgi:hypothetical protein